MDGGAIDMVNSEGISGRSAGWIVVCHIAEWWAEHTVKLVIIWIKGQWTKLSREWL